MSNYNFGDSADVRDEINRDVLARMSHKLHTPLNCIVTMAELAINDKDADPIAALKKIKYSGEYLLGLTNDLLDFLRSEDNRPAAQHSIYTISDFKSLISDIIAPQCSAKGLEFKTGFSSRCPDAVVCDKQCLNRVIFALLSNAVKYTQTGSVKLEVDFIPEISFFGTLMLQVTDTGCGISEKFLPFIFDIFSREDTAPTNTDDSLGIGLATAKELTELMGGTISAESVKDAGSVFTVQLPVSGAEKATRSSSAPLKDLRVLIAEDHPVNAEITMSILHRLGAAPELAANGKVALEKFSNSACGYYSAVLMDIRMPIMDGLHSAKAIRALDRRDAKRIPIIALSANAYDEDIKSSLAAGMSAHLSKPINPHELSCVLEKFVSVQSKQAS